MIVHYFGNICGCLNVLYISKVDWHCVVLGPALYTCTLLCNIFVCFTPSSLPLFHLVEIIHTAFVGLTGVRRTQGCVIFGPGKDLK